MAYFFAFFAFLAFLFFFFRWRQSRNTSAALDAAAQFSSRELGGIPLDGAIEFFGQVSPQSELVIAPFSGESGVWWRVLITEHWEEETGSGDDRRWESRSRVVRDEISGDPFLISDQFGSVLLDPVDVDFRSCKKTFNQRQDADDGFNLSIEIDLNPFSSDKRNRWLETEEWVLPSSVNVLTLAHVGQAEDGSRFLHKGEGQHNPFLVPSDSPEDYAASVQSSSGRWGAAALAAFLLTVSLIALGTFS